MATNDFKPFATGAGANVTAQAEWASLPALFTGFQSGKASSAQVNKAIRQASFISAALAQYVANKSGQDVLDDGDLAGFIAKLVSGLGKDFQPADATLTNLSGKSVAGLLTYLGLKEAAKRDVGTGQNQIPDMSSFIGGGGWMGFPDGTLIQMGTSISGPVGYPTTVYFPVPFTSYYKITTSFDVAGNNASDCPSFATSPAGTGLIAFYLMSSRNSNTNGAGANWIAIGK